MFYGEYEHQLDSKGRVFMPAKLRQVLEAHGVQKCYVTRGLDRCLFLYTGEEWKKQEEQFKALPMTKASARQFNRIYFGGATEVEFDRQGRINLPAHLKGYASIEKEVVFIGVSDRVEIWSREAWSSYFEKSQQTFEEVAERLVDGAPDDTKA
ncbi:MAG: division/cell wall cluster transcriptional repressor MraZ [Candidatus Omnitrophica bacterium]|nr:division/cell wall cluster transcriptional repressor MraZ [Candidatus Omnitrophota bacterium]